ncbi:MAG: energy transducer TonB [Thermodesulforhabdaceae bacterium]
MLFRFNLNERNVSILAFIISFSLHSLVFGVVGINKGWRNGGIQKEPVPIELVAVKKEEPVQEVPPPKIEEPEPPPPKENPSEPVAEKELEKTVSRPLPPPPPKKEAKKAPVAEKKGHTPRISPLIAKQYDKPDLEGMTVPPVPADQKLENAPPAVIPEPVMGKMLGKGTGADEDTSGMIKEVAFGSNQGPSFKNMVKPEYPEFARRLGQEGYVLLKVLVDETGRVKKAEVVKSAGRAFDEAALEAIKRSTFYPAREKGVPIPCYVKIPIRFQLVQR